MMPEYLPLLKTKNTFFLYKTMEKPYLNSYFKFHGFFHEITEIWRFKVLGFFFFPNLNQFSSVSVWSMNFLKKLYRRNDLWKIFTSQKKKTWLCNTCEQEMLKNKNFRNTLFEYIYTGLGYFILTTEQFNSQVWVDLKTKGNIRLRILWVE